ncbi:MAG: 4-hydroxy-tetrahydrodipicolinate reductase [Gammaproteobacteria bacterium]|nr:4-hydroxy-tetrahydrodipicolinate reductase [Gammaproteobacteria bacterium]
MGQTLVRALGEEDGLRLIGAVASPNSSRLGHDAAIEGRPTGVTVTSDPHRGLEGADVAIDFSLPQCVAAHAHASAQARVPLLVGTTGLDAAVRAALESAAAVIPVLIAPNTSVGVSVVAKLVEMATLALGAQYDVEISEAHHRLKRDAPSGTALALGEVVARARGRELPDVAVFDRHRDTTPRRAGDIGFAVVRAGDIVGEHTVTFAVAGERVEITHRATDRMTFARGALRAAKWLAGRPPGLYAMNDVIGLSQP